MSTPTSTIEAPTETFKEVAKRFNVDPGKLRHYWNTGKGNVNEETFKQILDHVGGSNNFTHLVNGQ